MPFTNQLAELTGSILFFPITKNNSKRNTKINNYDSGDIFSGKDTVRIYEF